MQSGKKSPTTWTTPSEPLPPRQPGKAVATGSDFVISGARKVLAILVKYVRFIGPGFLIAVAYIDPGNYATDVNGEELSPLSSCKSLLLDLCKTKND